MGSQAASTTYNISSSFFSSSNWVLPTQFRSSINPSNFPFLLHKQQSSIPFCRCKNRHELKFPTLKTRATLDDKKQNSTTPILVQEEQKPEQSEQLNEEVEKSVKVLKDAAKTRKVPSEEILSAFSVLEKAKLDPSRFLETLGGTESPGKTWMLVFTAQKKLERGKYFPITAVQRFDAAGKRIENGVYLGPLGQLTFEGKISWKKRILAFIFERIRVKIGPFNPFEINIKGKDEREPSNEDPFFIWFYIDEEIAVARGRGGGTAFWVHCRRVSSY